MGVKVSVSILGADIIKIGETIKGIEKSGADMIHFDVMDGVFVDNISFGIPVLESVNKHSEMCMDVHLMISNPYKYVKQFAQAGADIITFHYESESDVSETIDKIHEMGIKAGVSIKPETPVNVLKPYLGKIDMVLIMSVEPGFGGQAFNPCSIGKIEQLKKMAAEIGEGIDIEIDGGINNETGKLAVSAGADILVSGSYLLKKENLKEAVKEMQNFKQC